MNRLRALLRLLTAIAVLVLIALCCWQCIDIYITGTQANALPGSAIFSMPVVADRLGKMAPVFFACLGVIVISTILNISMKDENRSDASTPEYRLKQLKSHFVTLPEAARKEEAYRLTLRIVFSFMIGLVMLPALVYLLDIKHFTSWNLETVISDMLLHALPWFLLSLIAAAVAAHLVRRSIAREIIVLSSIPKPVEKPARSMPDPRQNMVIRCVLLFAALLFIVLGILNGGLYDVLVKAINICTECIGLG